MVYLTIYKNSINCTIFFVTINLLFFIGKLDPFLMLLDDSKELNAMFCKAEINAGFIKSENYPMVKREVKDAGHEVKLESNPKTENIILKLTNQIQRKEIAGGKFVFVCFVGSWMILFYFSRRKINMIRQRNLILENENQQGKEQVEKIKLEKQLLEKETERCRLDLEKKEQELVFQTLKQAGKEQVHQSVHEKLQSFSNRFNRKKDREEFSGILQEIIRDVSNDPLSDFEQLFIQMHGGFYEKLLEICPGLSQSELQMCALLRMNLPSKEIAKLLNLTVSTIDQRRHSIRKKFGLNGHENLVSYLICV